MKPAHAYAASFLPWLIAWLWWLNRDTGMFAAIHFDATTILLVAILGVLCWPTIRSGLASVWQRVRTNMPSESPGLIRGFFAGVFVTAVVISFAAWITASPWPTPPTPKPNVPVVKPDEPDKVSRVTYVYEKDDGSVPSGVLVALDKLNKQGILATAFEEDTVDGSGETPSQYKDALEASKDNRPALVVTRGKYLKVTPKPTTEAQVLEAAK